MSIAFEQVSYSYTPLSKRQKKKGETLQDTRDQANQPLHSISTA